MRRMIRSITGSGLAFTVLLWAGAAGAEAEIDHSPKALKQGAEVFLNTCHFCHSLKYVTFRSLQGVGLSKEEIRAAAGDLLETDTVAAQTPAATAKSMFGLAPPDLSLITKAREGGAHYVYSLLTGYYVDPQGATKNRVFPGVAMPDILSVGAASPQDRKAAEEKARHVAAFLAWAADPKAEERRHLGYYVLAYLILLTALLYVVKRRVWRRLGH